MTADEEGEGRRKWDKGDHESEIVVRQGGQINYLTTGRGFDEGQAVIRAAGRWRGITVGEFEQRQLRAIREELNHAHAERVAPAVAAKPAPPVRKLRVDR